ILRALAFAASSSRFFGGAVVSNWRSKRFDTAATSSTAARNGASFAFEGLLKPLIFLTNCSDAASTSSSVTGGSKLNSGLILRHIGWSRNIIGRPDIVEPHASAWGLKQITAPDSCLPTPFRVAYYTEGRYKR